MKLKLITLACLGATSIMAATPTGGLFPRSLAMGGTGVTIGDVTTAAHYNPALLSSTKILQGFSLVLPSIGARLSDPDDFIDAIESFQDSNIIDRLDYDTNNIRSSQDFSGLADGFDELN